MTNLSHLERDVLDEDCATGDVFVRMSCNIRRNRLGKWEATAFFGTEEFIRVGESPEQALLMMSDVLARVIRGEER